MLSTSPSLWAWNLAEPLLGFCNYKVIFEPKSPDNATFVVVHDTVLRRSESLQEPKVEHKQHNRNNRR